MIKALLPCLMASAALVVSAATTAPVGSLVPMASSGTAKADAAQVVSTVSPSAGKLNVLGADGRVFKNVAAPRINKVINPAFKKAAATARESATAIFFESFENPGSDYTWLPEGWTMESKGDPELTDGQKWGTHTGGQGLPSPTDGGWLAIIDYSSRQQDEWLITPEITIPDGLYNLTYDIYVSPVFFFNLGSGYMDWNTSEFIKQEIIFDFEVLVSADGGEFEKVQSLAERFVGMSYLELEEYGAGMESRQVSLADYRGKNIRIAFRYVGTDGQTEFLDNVLIDHPAMTLDMMQPLSTQYFGLGSEFSVMNLNTGIAVYPVNAPLTFMNNTWEDYDYTWHYCDPETGDWTTSNDPYELTVQYAPDYSSDFTKRNNLFYPPYLTATAEGYSEGRADMPAVTYIQAGGAPEWVEKIGEDEFSFEFGLLPFNVIDTKISYYTEPAPEYGERSTPIFGHDKNTTKYWTDYTFRGDAGENDKAEVVSVLNFIYTSEGMNLVFDKAWIHAVGMVAADAEFTLSVHDMVPVYDEDGDYIGEAPNEDPIASATLLGKDVAGNFETDMINSLSFVFSFDEPVVLDDSSNAYIVKFSGFNSDKVTWLAPVQQWKPNGWALGWIEKAITYDGVTRNSYNPIAYQQNEYGDMMCAFDINLGGWYPWLDAEDQTVELGSACTGQINLATYYKGEDLSIECSPWIEAVGSGRYDECVINITAEPADASREGYVIVNAPGVETRTFKVTQDLTGITSVETAGRQVKAVYTPAGTPASLDVPGVYIVTYTDGTVEKKVVK